jgi:hypothetical protein
LPTGTVFLGASGGSARHGPLVSKLLAFTRDLPITYTQTLPCSGEGDSLLCYSDRTEYKARHVGDGRGEVRCMYLATVNSATS